MFNLLVCNSLTYSSNLFLNNGITFTSFHSKGTTPSFNDKLDTGNGIFVLLFPIVVFGELLPFLVIYYPSLPLFS